MATKSILAALAVSIISAISTAAITHGDEHGTAGKKAAPAMEKTAFGQTGDPKKVTRTINVGMHSEAGMIGAWIAALASWRPS